METFIKNALNKYSINNNLLSPHQHGFVSGRSTITQPLVTLQDLFYNLDNGLSTDAFTWISKKHSTLSPLNRLLKKLEDNGIKGSVLNG